MGMSTHLYHRLIGSLLIGCLFTACKEERGPASLMPDLNVEEAGEITRTSALLSGEVRKAGTGTVTVLQFRYGTSPEMEDKTNCEPSLSSPSAMLTDLKPNTTYYYCLEAGNGYSSVQSSALRFTTKPNQVPVIGDLQMLGQGPLSITLQCELTDDGGETVTSAGFYYRADGGEEKRWVVNREGGSLIRARIGELQEQTSYTVQAYAANSIGETRGEEFRFHTRQAVITTLPGTLSETIGTHEKYRYTSLSIAGPLNGTDLRFIREMLGKDVDGQETAGRMSRLDLADAVICSGGASYDGMRHTTDKRIGSGMFSDCLYLQKLILPDSTVEIEENAFGNCPVLDSLLIPAATTKVAPSLHCKQLAIIEAPAGNRTFADIDGVLYDKEHTCLFWFPEGREEAPSFPPTLTSIGEYAFGNCRLKTLELPSTISQISKGAFWGAQLETIVLPEALELIPNGLFQGCGSLVSITLGRNTGYLSDYCFEGCPLQHLYVKAEDIPPMCKENTFTEELFGHCTLHVPAGCLTKYRNSTYWGKFEKIVEE